MVEQDDQNNMSWKSSTPILISFIFFFQYLMAYNCLQLDMRSSIASTIFVNSFKKETKIFHNCLRNTSPAHIILRALHNCLRIYVNIYANKIICQVVREFRLT